MHFCSALPFDKQDHMEIRWSSGVRQILVDMPILTMVEGAV